MNSQLKIDINILRNLARIRECDIDAFEEKAKLVFAENSDYAHNMTSEAISKMNLEFDEGVADGLKLIDNLEDILYIASKIPENFRTLDQNQADAITHSVDVFIKKHHAASHLSHSNICL